MSDKVERIKVPAVHIEVWIKLPGSAHMYRIGALEYAAFTRELLSDAYKDVAEMAETIQEIVNGTHPLIADDEPPS